MADLRSPSVATVTAPTPRFDRALRALRFVAATVASALTFVLALGAGAAFHADLPTARRLAVAEINAALSAVFTGRIVLESVAGLGVAGARGVDARLVAADGTTLAIARGARARIEPVALVRSLLRGAGDLQVGVFGIDVESLDVSLDADEAGKLKLQTALEPTRPSPSSPPSAGAGRPLRLELPDIAVRHAFVHGRMKGIPAIDADLDALRGSLRVDPTGVFVAVTRADLVARAMPQRANPIGAVAVHVAIPSANGRPVGLDVSFDGSIGNIPATVRLALDGDRLDAVLDVPEVPDERVRALFPQAPVHRPAAGHAEAHGELPSVTITARLTAGAAEATAKATLALARAFGATGGIDVRGVDLNEMVPGAPPSSLSLHGDFRVDTKEDGTLHGHFTAAVPGGDVGGQFVPAATLRGDFTQLTPSSRGASGDGLEVTVQGVVAEPGAPTEVVAALRTDGPVPIVRFQAKTRIDWLAKVKRVGGLGPGRAQIQMAGTVTFASTPSFDATLDADIQALEHPPVYSEEARVTAHAFGPFADARLTAAIDADGVRAASYAFRRGRVTAAGALSAETVTLVLEGDGGPGVRARATVSLANALRLTNAELDLARGDKALHATAKEVRIDPSGIRVVGGSLTGLGEPASASLDTRPGSLVVQGSSKGVDLEALGYLLGLEDNLRKGRLSFAIDLSARPDGADGSVMANLENGSFGSLDGLSGHVEAQMDGRKVTGELTSALRDVARLNVSELDVELGGKGALDGTAWRRAWGSLRVDGQVDLAKGAALLPPNALPLSRLEGQLTLQAHVRRDDEADITPDVAIALKTFGLRVAPRRAPDGKGDKTTLVAPPAWDLFGIDLQVDAQADGASGFAEVAARLVDKEGVLVSLDAKSAALPYERLFASSDGALDLLKDVPFSALLVAPSRRLDRLPDILQPAGARGEAEARLAIEGTCRKPAVELTATAHGARLAVSPIVRAVDAKLTGKYDGTSGDWVLEARPSKSGVVHADLHVNAKVEDFFSQPAAQAPWDASGTATFTGFPLGAIAFLNDRQVRGQTSGRVELTGLHKDARVIANLSLKDLTVATAPSSAGSFHATLDGHSLEARAHLEQNGALVTATARVATRWGTAMAPSVDSSGPAVATLQARQLHASLFAPFVGSVLDELDGLIDADAQIALAPEKKPEMSGTITLRDGLVEVTALGEEFHAVKARLRLTPDGVLRLEDAAASGTTGRLTASGVARLDGLALLDAEAAVKIDHDDAIPLDLQGSSLGTVYGQFNLKAKTAADRQTMSLNVDVPLLHVALPEASTHSVQELDEAGPETHAGIYLAPGRFVALALDGFDTQQQEQAVATAAQPSSTLTVDVHLGQNVEIERGTDLRVELEGNVTSKVAQANEVTGRVVLKGGKLDVQGKSFEIQSGTVTFLGDPSNPEVNVTAGWTASDGTRVYADYIGPLKTGKVILRSEPIRPQNEILGPRPFRNGRRLGSLFDLQPAVDEHRAIGGDDGRRLRDGGAQQGARQADRNANHGEDRHEPGVHPPGGRRATRAGHLAADRRGPGRAVRSRHDARDLRLALPEELVARDDVRQQGHVDRRRGLAASLLTQIDPSNLPSGRRDGRRLGSGGVCSSNELRAVSPRAFLRLFHPRLPRVRREREDHARWILFDPRCRRRSLRGRHRLDGGR